MKANFGVVGLAVMGENLARNVERNGFTVAVYNRTFDRIDALLAGKGKGKNFVGARTLRELADALERPRRILIMVKAGAPVDSVLKELAPLLDPGDVVVDGGNSHYLDTERRGEALAPTGIRFFGMGVSGGEEGALNGPSLMPGGDRAAYADLEPILTRIAAKTDTGPCVTYVGEKGSGHFVKMVHNGIEYGDMQLIAETYDVMRSALGLPAREIAEVFARWNEGPLRSYLIEITAKVVDFPDEDGTPLIERIRDEAAQKGTGKWTTESAMEFGVPVPTITAAVDARLLSAERAARAAVREAAPSPADRARPAPLPADEVRRALAALESALYASKICSYAQGFELMRRASAARSYGVRLGEMARIWKGGCIIRAIFLDRIRAAFERDANLPNLLADPDFAREIASREGAWREAVGRATAAGLTPPAITASLAYSDALRRGRLPANLIQGQRDFFGAHTYERIDRAGTFHTDWSGRPGSGASGGEPSG